MPLDRTGEPIEEDAHKCWGGWATPPDADQPRRCPVCRPAPAQTTAEYEPHYSDAAAAAIARADREDQAR